MAPAVTAPVAAALTSGNPIEELTKSKIVKDLVADFLLTGAAALGTVQILDLNQVLATPDIAAIALSGAVIRVLYRAVLKWAQS